MLTFAKRASWKNELSVEMTCDRCGKMATAPPPADLVRKNRARSIREYVEGRKAAGHRVMPIFGQPDVFYIHCKACSAKAPPVEK